MLIVLHVQENRPFLLLKERFSEAPRLILSEVNGGDAYKLPSHVDRFHVPWFHRSHERPPTAIESSHRYLYSPTRKASTGGLSHSMGAINADLNLALRLNVTYTHRIGDYSSLSIRDRYAVERFFGWGVGHPQREAIHTAICTLPAPPTRDIYSCAPCALGSNDNASRVIKVPSSLSPIACRGQPSRCNREAQVLAKKFNDTNTVFETPLKHCGPQEADYNFVRTKGLFYNQYWQVHAQFLPWSPAPFPAYPSSLSSLSFFSSSNSKKTSLSQDEGPFNTTRVIDDAGAVLVNNTTSRLIRFAEDELTIAVHFRHREFLEPTTNYTSDLSYDESLARTIQRVLLGIKQVGGPFARLPRVVVHIYSDRRPFRKRKDEKSMQSPSMFNQKYYDQNSAVRNMSWWRGLLLKEYEDTTAHAATRKFESRLSVEMHTSEDIFHTTHELASADIVICSMSGFSVMLVWTLARGVLIIPRHNPQITEMHAHGILCCTVPLDGKSSNFSLSLFIRFWSAYSRTNGETVEHHVSQQDDH